MKKPEISVVMAVYNGMPYLKEAVKSILNQTFKIFEFIIVDDASKDNTWNYLKSIKDKRIRLIKNERNIGLAASLNKGLDNARADYIARMDADDISLKNRLKEQLKFMKQNLDVDLCGTWANLIDYKGEITGEVHKPLTDQKIKKMNQWVPGMVHPTWLGKKSLFEKLHGYDPQYDMAEDYDFLIRAKKFTMANVDKELFLWRSVQNRRSKKTIEKMYKKSLLVRWKYFKKGEFGITYLPFLIRSWVTIYFIPTKWKIFLNKKAGLL